MRYPPAKYNAKGVAMSDTNGKTQEAPKEGKDKKATQTRDPELKAMAKVSRIMDELDADAKRRVASWIHDRWEISPANRFFGDLKTEVVNKLRTMESR